MVELVAIPRAELQRISQANTGVLDVAEALLRMARSADDPLRKKELELAVSRLLTSSNSVSGAVQSTAYVRSR